MTLVSNDSAWWPFMLSTQMTSYVVAAFSFGLMYDWALTFGREVELVWRQHWSFMTVLYLGVRCAGISHAIINIQCRTMFDALCWLNVAVTAMLGVIMIARIIFLAVNIADGVITTIVTSRVESEVFILFGITQCASHFQEGSDDLLLALMTWILPAVWEVFALYLAIRIAFKRLRELQRPLTGWLDVRDCFVVLTKTHVIYFASFVAVSGFILPYALLTAIAETVVAEHQIYSGLTQTFIVTMMCVLGPRLILGVREYHAKLVADSERGPDMTSIAFEERVHVSTGISV
ncbi:hypothetical protein BDR06DRAFT_1005544 [Suillus hirtellus]|nr:hypothetical protein BDR06DRAFT_1005544 [Suillus hirtellus]